MFCLPEVVKNIELTKYNITKTTRAAQVRSYPKPCIILLSPVVPPSREGVVGEPMIHVFLLDLIYTGTN